MLKKKMKRMAVRWLLLPSTAEPNESLGLELPRPCVSLGGAITHQCGERNRPNLGVLIRDQGKAK